MCIKCAVSLCSSEASSYRYPVTRTSGVSLIDALTEFDIADISDETVKMNTACWTDRQSHIKHTRYIKQRGEKIALTRWLYSLE